MSRIGAPFVLPLAILLSFTACTAQTAPSPPGPPQRVLFVGNSLTYYGNSPAVFSALAEANGTSVVSDMIVAPGATLTQRVSDGSVARALEDKEYSALVLQERGGDFICAFGPDSCVQAWEAIKALAALARERGVKAMLIGSYQRLPEVSRSLVEAEASAAVEAGIRYIEVSEKLRRLTETAPELAWFAADGQHPGKHLALLNALLVHEAVLGSLPESGALVGHADSSVTLSRRTSAVGKARECRTGRSQFKRAERSPRCLCGGPSGAPVPARLGVAFLGKGAAIPCETRLDSHRHSGSECYLTSRVAH